MSPLQKLTKLSIDQLENNIIGLSKRVTAAEYDFLVLLREFDLRQGWKAYHFNHCAEWLNMKCGMHPNTGREKLRVAHALWDLPLLSAASQSGELPYSKARALTRVATPANESALLDYAMQTTAERVENHCRALRNAQRDVSTADANRAHGNRYLSRCTHGDGSMTISVELPQEQGELVLKALECAMAARERDAREQSMPDGNTSAEVLASSKRDDNWFAHQADALVEIAQSYLAGGSEKNTSTADHYQVVVHVDAAALAATDNPEQLNAKSDLPIESVRRLCCDTGLVAVSEDEKGHPLDVGRKHRVVQPALRRALLARDKCCRYPGCTHRKWLDAHHVKHWMDGGETSLDNTMLLCSKHHRLLHEGGFKISKNHAGEWYFQTSTGKTLPQGPVYRLEDDPDYELLQESAETTGIAERGVVYRIPPALQHTSAEVSYRYHTSPCLRAPQAIVSFMT